MGADLEVNGSEEAGNGVVTDVVNGAPTSEKGARSKKRREKKKAAKAEERSSGTRLAITYSIPILYLTSLQPLFREVTRALLHSIELVRLATYGYARWRRAKTGGMGGRLPES
ncbi:hypothetical protein CYMTET_44418 [Cymbomonas tetramitiformis]|uniref:Uncharacterized protein n=1 Tax=Cymbomonas tetramitiformis TaxID=36881 RepID=A0AAE0C078_9CHLO|nr:hypothetical protein CYMTET_44417 [Cymbomonas tetramitiformis]KAK3246032.1 hypothetical protein CYMTET_44418 [Cymbomonas tetramitiformis]